MARARTARQEAWVEQRRGAMRALAGEVARVAAPVLGKRGFAASQLVTEWQSVVGSHWAARLSPEKLDFPRGERQGGTLRLRAAAGAALEAQHQTPLLLQRINGFFGYCAVERIVLVQGPPLRREAPAARKPAPLGRGDRDELDRRLGAIDDPALREALRRLGEAVLGTRAPD
jgi:hypothetical protein